MTKNDYSNSIFTIGKRHITVTWKAGEMNHLFIYFTKEALSAEYTFVTRMNLMSVGIGVNYITSLQNQHSREKDYTVH